MSETPGRGREMARGYSEPVLAGDVASDYERYRRTDELLSLQKPRHEMVHRDELLFQVVHQSSELWLKLAVTEVGDAAKLLEQGDVPAANRLLRRGVMSLGYVISHLDMLGQMSPWEYQEIRVVLGMEVGLTRPGSGRSRALQEVSGAFNRLITKAGLDLVDLYLHGRQHEDLYQLAELLTEWDERIRTWRFHHYAVVARALGEKTTGTQGTPVQVLGRLIAQRQLPELWEVRTRLVELLDATAVEAGER